MLDQKTLKTFKKYIKQKTNMMCLLLILIIYFQKIVELNFTVKARESKLIDLSKKNAELAASNSEMKR